MNIFQQQNLTKEEIRLIEKVLDFQLQVNNTKICFRGIEDKIELDLSKNMTESESIDISILQEMENKTKEQIGHVKKEYESKVTERNNYYKTLSRDDRYSDTKLQQLCKECNQLESLLGILSMKNRNIKNAIQNGGNIETALLGFFKSEKRKVYLCLTNIVNASIGCKREVVLIKTFIHEMFHAWNFFASGEKERSIREIDEPMVEYCTLIFLNEFAQKEPEFKVLLDWAESSVREKQSVNGDTAAYGFGYYLYSLTNKDSNVMLMLEEYFSKSGNISDQLSEVKSIQKLLYPSYPFDKESRTLNLFYNIIIGKSYPKGGNGIGKWTQEILDCINKIPTNDFCLEDVYLFVNDLKQKHPNNNHIRAKIRQQIQDLCKTGRIQRIDTGKYRK